MNNAITNITNRLGKARPSASKNSRFGVGSDVDIERDAPQCRGKRGQPGYQ
jgi:hypothetical protein